MYRFLIINTDYSDFLHWLYAQYVGLEHRAYEEQMQACNESMFGLADFYPSNLRKLGYEAWEIHANNEFMQKAWAREHGMGIEEPASWHKGGVLLCSKPGAWLRGRRFDT